MAEESAEVLVDRGGVVVARYVRVTRDGAPCAVRIEELGPRADVVRALMESRRGWAVVGAGGLGTALVDAGATWLRHAHQLLRDLRADPPDPAWARLAPPSGLRTGPVETGPAAPLAALGLLARRAYPEGHPDHRTDADLRHLDEAHATVLRDRSAPLCPSSALVLDGDRIVAVALITDHPAGPWLYNLMRDPDARYAGLGGLLLRRGLALAAGHGDRTMGLAVSDGNPARHLYDRLAFRPLASFVTVHIPGTLQAAPTADQDR